MIQNLGLFFFITPEASHKFTISIIGSSCRYLLSASFSLLLFIGIPTARWDAKNYIEEDKTRDSREFLPLPGPHYQITLDSTTCAYAPLPRHILHPIGWWYSQLTACFASSGVVVFSIDSLCSAMTQIAGEVVFSVDSLLGNFEAREVMVFSVVSFWS